MAPTTNWRASGESFVRYGRDDDLGTLQTSPWLFRLEARAGEETFSRSSTATYRDAGGTLQTASSGELRDEHYVDI